MITQSGRMVMPDNDVAPTIEDIALGLGRMPRFAGQTDQWWPVLMHSLLVADIIMVRGGDTTEIFYGLMHDAHEAVVGDTPSTWKCADVKQICRDLDVRIFGQFGMKPPHLAHPKMLKDADQDALLAEVQAVGNPYIKEHYRKTNRMGDPRLTEMARHAKGLCYSPMSTAGGISSPMVIEFIRRAERLIRDRV